MRTTIVRAGLFWASVAAFGWSMPGEAHAASPADDIQTVRQRMIAQLTAPPLTQKVLEQAADRLAPAGPSTQPATAPESKADAIAKALQLVQADGSFSDVNYGDKRVNDSWGPAVGLGRTLAFAVAFATPGGKFHNDPRLKAAALAGIAFWDAHNFHSANWFWNDIGVPGLLGRTCLILWDDVPAAEKPKALAIIGQAQLKGTSANLVWESQIVAIRGLLTGDAPLVKSAFDRIAAEIHVFEHDGPQVDNSFLFHGPLMYTFGYGIGFLNDNAELATLVADTEFAFPQAKINLIAGWTLDGAQWLTRGPGADYGAIGRTISRPGTSGSEALVRIGECLLKVHADRQQELKDMIARATANPAEPPLIGNKQFWRADMMVQSRAGYYASARLYSARTRNTEWGNGEALENFYLCDGSNVLMKSGLEYFNIFPIWDWQHLPGTTVEIIPNFGPVAGREGDPAPDAFIPNRNGIVHKSTETFVGGVSDGRYGIFCGKFSRGPLHVNRGWFFFDQQFICMGSDLSCDSDNPVNTSLDQRWLDGDVTVSDSDGVHRLPEGEHDEPALSWVLHDGVSYIFSTPMHVQVENHEQTGSWGLLSNANSLQKLKGRVFNAWIDHGARPTGANYAYTVLPNTSSADTTAYAANPQAVVVSNTAEQQAVWQSKLKRGGVIFYTAGKATLRDGLSVSVDQPVAIMCAETDGGLAVSAANPENKPMKVKVSIERNGKSSDLEMHLPGGDLAGSTVTMSIGKLN